MQGGTRTTTPEGTRGGCAEAAGRGDRRLRPLLMLALRRARVRAPSASPASVFCRTLLRKRLWVEGGVSEIRMGRSSIHWGDRCDGECPHAFDASGVRRDRS